MGERENRWLASSLLLLAALAVLDLVLESSGFEGAFVVGPVVASTNVRARRTAVVAVLAVLAGVVAAAARHRLGDLGQIVRLISLGAIGAFCVVGAAWRERREKALRRVTRVAEVAQLAILRPIPPRVGPMAFASRYLSAAEQAFIGGDLYDVVPSGKAARVVIGDVRGKGLEAVHLAALVLGSFREAAMVEGGLLDVAAAVDQAVAMTIGLEDFVTALFVEFRPGGEVALINCGHHPPLRVVSGGSELLGPAGTSAPLGLTPDLAVQQHRLRAGERLLLYTDGLVEARSPDRAFFTLEGEVTALLSRRSLDAALDGLVAKVLNHAGGRLDDDLALLLTELRG